MYKSIAISSQYGFGLLSVSCWFDAYIFSSLVQQTSFTLLMWLRWNLINLWHDEFTVMYSNVPKRTTQVAQLVDHLTCMQAGVVVLFTAMGKWLLACLQMAISAGSTHGLPWNCFSRCSNISKKIEDKCQLCVCTMLSSLWCIETNLGQKYEPG